MVTIANLPSATRVTTSRRSVKSGKVNRSIDSPAVLHRQNSAEQLLLNVITNFFVLVRDVVSQWQPWVNRYGSFK